MKKLGIALLLGSTLLSGSARAGKIEADQITPGAAASDSSITNPKAFGARCDGVTNDQTAMQAALVSAEALGRTLLVPGVCVISGLSVNSPVVFQGLGDRSQLMLASGSIHPAVSISIPKTAPGVLNDFTAVTFRDLAITAPDRTDGNKALEHGITATNGSPAVNLAVNLINVNIFGIPGDGLHLEAFTGYFKLVNSKILLPGMNGLNCNSSTDTVIDGGEFYGAVEYNWLLSSCTNTKISNSNEFTAQKSGVYVYQSSDVVFNNDTIDTAGFHALEIHNLANQTVTVLGGLIRWSGTSANVLQSATKAADGSGGVNNTGVYTVGGGTCTTQPTVNATWASGVMTVNSVANAGFCSAFPTSPATLTYASGAATGWTGATANLTQGGVYYDVLSGAGNAGVTTLFGVHFPTPASSFSPNKPAGNVGFYDTSSAPINCFDCVFDLGPIGSPVAGITNSSTGQLYSGSKQPFTIDSQLQFAGASGFNGATYPWKIFCSSVLCDNGALALSNGGATGVLLLASGQSIIPSLTLSTIPSSAGTGGMYVCVDSTGATYKKASCP